MTVLSVSAYLTMRRNAPSYAANVRDDVHRRAANGSEILADVLAALIDEDAWWGTPSNAAPATA